jgi:hypothetical protein
MTPDDARQRGTLSVDEAAVLAGVGRDAMYDAVRAGIVPRLPFPERVIRVPAGHLLAMLGYPTHDPTSRAAEGVDATDSPGAAPSQTIVPFGSTGSPTDGHG